MVDEQRFEVTLQDCSGVSEELKAKAEARFAKPLWRCFPNQEAMTEAYKIYTDAAEGGIISKAQERLAHAWVKACDTARQAGFRDIAVEEAYFEVRM